MGEITPVTVWVSTAWRERREEGSIREDDGESRQGGQPGRSERWASGRQAAVGLSSLNTAAEHTHSQRTRVCRA